MRMLTPPMQGSAFWALASGVVSRSDAASRVAVRIGPPACVGLERRRCTQMSCRGGVIPIGCLHPTFRKMREGWGRQQIPPLPFRLASLDQG